MVEPVGSLSQLFGRTVQPTAPASAVAGPRAVAARGDEAQVAATDLTRSLSESAPIDMERVARIKAAIANGTYPIAPETIADRLLALRLAWRPQA